MTIAAAVAVVSAIGTGALAAQLASRGHDRARLPADLHLRAASAPFAGYQETRIELDGRCRRVAVADTGPRRADGLRGRTDLGRYAGMLFVFDGDTQAAFTMAGVTDPLEIGWYTADGARIGGAHMAPCPHRTQAECPVYASRKRYRLALERPGGTTSASGLTPCG